MADRISVILKKGIVVKAELCLLRKTLHQWSLIDAVLDGLVKIIVVYLASAYQVLTEVQCDCIDEAGVTWGSLKDYFESAFQDGFNLLSFYVVWRDLLWCKIDL